jgi:hypothetical protein
MTDTERLDFLQREGFTAECIWTRNRDWAGGDEWRVYRPQHNLRPPLERSGQSLRETIDAVASALRTGG